MNTFNWSKGLGYGVGIWAVAGLALWALTLTTLSAGLAHGIVAIVLGVAAFLFALDVKPEKVTQAFAYGVVWVAVGVVLDALITRIFDAHIFTTWQYYLGYGLTLAAPLVRFELPKIRSLSV